MKSSTVTSAGSGKMGRRDSPSFSGSEQRRAISTEFCSASGMSANNCHISSGERRYCASVYLRTRAGSVSCAPSAIQTRASWDSKSDGPQEAHVVGGHHRNAALLAERHAAGHECFIVRPGQSLQFQVVTIAEQLLPLARQGKRLGLAAGEQRAAHVAFGRARERDESRGISASSQPRSISGVPRSWPSSQARVMRLVTFWYPPGSLHSRVSRAGTARSPRMRSSTSTPTMGLTPCCNASR